MQLQIVRNSVNSITRKDTMEGRAYLVAPMVMLVEGVHAGSEGPLFYPREELEKTPQVWNHKPIVVYHPTINGEGVSACEPSILTSCKVGVIMNATTDDGKLKAEAWLDEERLAKVDSRVSDAIARNAMVEISTGLFTDNATDPGVFKGKAYNFVARNYRPDHLAILPDIKGACSIADGAGLLRLNSQQMKDNFGAINDYFQKLFVINLDKSFDDIRSALCGLIYEKYGDNCWVCDVYQEYLVYSNDGKLYKVNYLSASDKTSLVGDAIQVERVTEYKPVGTPPTSNQTTDRSITMSRKDSIDRLIANGRWEAEDREFLEKASEAKFAKIIANDETLVEVKKQKDEAAEKKGEPAPAAAATAPAANSPAAPQTLNQYIANAPPEYRDVINAGIRAHAQQKEQLIGKIVANAANPFSKEFLATKGIDELQGLAALAQSALPQSQPGYGPVAMFHGAQGGAPIANAGNPNAKRSTLTMPVMNFGPDKN